MLAVALDVCRPIVLPIETLIGVSSTLVLAIILQRHVFHHRRNLLARANERLEDTHWRYLRLHQVPFMILRV